MSEGPESEPRVRISRTAGCSSLVWMTKAPSTSLIGLKPRAWPRSYPPAMTRPWPKEPDQTPAATVVISLVLPESTWTISEFRRTAIRKSKSKAGMGNARPGQGKWLRDRWHASSTVLPGPSLHSLSAWTRYNRPPSLKHPCTPLEESLSGDGIPVFTL